MLLTVHFRGSATAGEIAGRFAHKWPTTTRHLRVLEDAGLLRHERHGRTRVYSVDKTRLALVTEWLGWFDSPSPSTSTLPLAASVPTSRPFTRSPIVSL